MEAQLKSWGVKLDELVAKAEDAGAEAKVDYRQGLDDLQTKYRAAQWRFEELRVAGGEKWDILKHGIESAWKELEVAFGKVTN